MSPRVRVLFLCTGNSCRSQMAEGWARALLPDLVDPCSAGIESHGLNDLAVRVMAEAGIDIAGQKSKTLESLFGPNTNAGLTERIDCVVTVCDHAAVSCPAVPLGVRQIHRSFPDPPALARLATGEGDSTQCYRSVRDEIHDFVMSLPETLASA